VQRLSPASVASLGSRFIDTRLGVCRSCVNWFVDVTIVSVDDRSLLAGQTVLIRDDRIAAAGPSNESITTVAEMWWTQMVTSTSSLRGLCEDSGGS
jgi:hypothetical protein